MDSLVAWCGFVDVLKTSIAQPSPSGRSTQIGVVSSKLTATPYSRPSVASSTSFCTSP